MKWITDKRPTRIATIGSGFGAAVHVPAILGQENAEFVGLIGRDQAKNIRLLRDLKLAPSLSCSTLNEALKRKPDILTVALPPDQNERVICEAADAGCAILCEKPLAENVETAERLVKITEGIPTAIDFQFAELAAFQELSQLIESKKLGSIRHVSVLWLVESYAQRNRLWSWKSDKKQGGGVMNLLGAHIFYLAEYLFGPATRLCASFNNASTQAFANKPERAAEDLVHFRLEHSSGTIFSATIGNACAGLHHHQWHVVGEKESWLLENRTSDYMSGFSLSSNEKTLVHAQKNNDGNSEDGRINPFRKILSKFINSCQQGDWVAFQPNFKDGLRVQLLMESARLSARINKEVSI